MSEDQPTKTTNTDAGSRPRRRPPRSPCLIGPTYVSIAEAARRLGMTAEALRARCRRGEAKREGQDVRVYLGDGVFATKFGRTWRVRFPE